MFDSASPSDAAVPAAFDLPASVRVDARLRLDIAFADGQSRIIERREAGAFRFRFPRAHGRAPEAVMVNIAGGLAGGDTLGAEIAVGEGATLAVSSAAAERIYRSAGDTTHLSTRLALDPDATALWLPQETILHDGARVSRRIEIEVAASARLVFGEMLFLGRRASGEGYGYGGLRESWRLRREGKLILADETRFGGDFAADILRPAALGSHVAMATLLLAHPDAGDHLAAIRANLDDEVQRDADLGLECGASDLGGLVLIRFASHDAARLRARYLRLAERLATLVGQPMPRALMN
jgi:urease accessory protein